MVWFQTISNLSSEFWKSEELPKFVEKMSYVSSLFQSKHLEEQLSILQNSNFLSPSIFQIYSSLWFENQLLKSAEVVFVIFSATEPVLIDTVQNW